MLFLFSVLLFSTSCAPSQKWIKSHSYDYNGLSAKLASLHKKFQDIVTIESIGETYEGRSIFSIRLSGNVPSLGEKPALMTICAQRGIEHGATDLCVEMIQYLAENYGVDKRVTHLLNEAEVWVVPMMNPDGTEYDRSGLVELFSWNKNRRPIGENAVGVELNRNWGHNCNGPISENLAQALSDPNSPFYAGKEPFSEKETQAIQTFLLSHKNIKVFVVYRSYFSSFIQGFVNCSRKDKSCLGTINRFAREISNFREEKIAFVAVKSEEDLSKMLEIERRYVPFRIKRSMPKNLPLESGTFLDFAYCQMGRMAIGVTILNDQDFLKNLPESRSKLVKNQAQGILLLLTSLSDKDYSQDLFLTQ